MIVQESNPYLFDPWAVGTHYVARLFTSLANSLEIHMFIGSLEHL